MATVTTSKKRDLHKSLGFSFLTKDEFDLVIKTAGQRFKKECEIKVEHEDDGVYISCGPVIFFVRKDGRFIERRFVRKEKFEVISPNTDLVTSLPEIRALQPRQDKSFPLFVTASRYVFDFNNRAVLILNEVLKEVVGDKVKEHDKKDFGKMKHAAMMIGKLAAPLDKNGKHKSLQDLMRILFHYIWKYADQDCMKIIIKCVGYGANTADFNLLGENLEEIKGIYAATPALIPIWLGFQYDQRAQHEPTGLMADGWEIHRQIRGGPNDRQQNIKTESVVQDIRENLKRINASSGQIWKYICRMKPRWARTFMSRCRPEYRSNMLSLLAEVGELPKYTVFKEICANCYNFGVGDNHHEVAQPTAADRIDRRIKIAFLRASFRASKKKLAKKFYTAEASLVWDWISKLDRPLDHNQLRSPWTWYMEKQKSWHEEEILRQRERMAAEKAKREEFEKNRKYAWDSLIEPFDRNGYHVVPLLKAQDLREEGEEMHHCVGSYDRTCEEGTCRIFSIQKEGKRVATLDIRKMRDISKQDENLGWRWVQQQIRGSCNIEPEDEVKRIGDFTLMKYNQAQSEYEKDYEEKKAKGEEVTIQYKCEAAPPAGIMNFEAINELVEV